MDKLGSCIGTMDANEVSNFKSYLRLKSKSGQTKKMKLFVHLFNGRDKEHIQQQLYKGYETDSAYYQLRKSLLEDLETFFLLNRIKSSEEASIHHVMVLAERAKHRGHSDLARCYYSQVLDSPVVAHHQALAVIARKELQAFSENNFMHIYEQYKNGKGSLTIDALLTEYPISFFTYLNEEDVQPALALLSPLDHVNKEANSFIAYKQLFLTNYSLFRLKQYDKALEGIEQLMKSLALDESTPLTLLVWSHLLKSFIYVRQNMFETAIDMALRIDGTLFYKVGSQYQLMMLRWWFIMYVKCDNQAGALKMILRLIHMKDDLIVQVGRSQVVKLFVFMARYCNKHERSNMFSQIMQSIKACVHLPEESRNEEKIQALLERFVLRFTSYSVNHMRPLKAPEDIVVYWIKNQKTHGKEGDDKNI